MAKRPALLLFCSIVAGILLVTACSSPSTTTTTTSSTITTTSSGQTTTQPVTTAPGAEKPKYGGTLGIVSPADPAYWDPSRIVVSSIINLTHEQTFQGDWAKGPAGGFGQNLTDWGYADNDLFDLKTGYVAESVKWSTDAQADQGTIVYTVREGVHWG